jgi:GTP-binding protein
VRPIPKIALVGRPNVGKSTLFNRIVGRRKAIIDARPGSTRDRNYAQTAWQGASFELVDTGGLLLGSNDPLLGPAAAQAALAIDESDLVVFVVDGRAGLMPDDRTIAAELRKKGKPVLVAVNKSESAEDFTPDFAALGFDELLPVSAEHGQGVGDLLDAALARVPKVDAPPDEAAPIGIALVGRPNVGKSSLLNRYVKEERALVSPIPGTTRDAVDSLLVKDGKRYLFVDTAGIRRSRHLKENVDHVSVVQSKKSIERADVAVLLLDADEGLKEMDATVGGYLQDAGRAVVIAVNKWDLAEEKGVKQRAFREAIRDHLKFLSWAPIVFISAKTGKGLSALLSTAEKVYHSARTRVTTGQLNRVIGRAAQAHAPRGETGGAAMKILFTTQVGIAPPTFVVSVNHPVDLHFSYKRYLENQIREAFGFEGTPLVLKVKFRRH